MRIEQVKKLPVRQRFYYWIRERRQIQLKRASGQPKPWTDDEILRAYRFCNVKRIDDKVSQWLLHNWYVPLGGKVEPRTALIAVTVARHFNNIPTLKQLPKPHRYEREWLVDVEKVLRNRKEQGLNTFGAAYVISGGTGGPKGGKFSDKITMVLDRVIRPLLLSPPEIDTDSMYLTHDRLCKYRGIASFMAGQIVADLRWALPGEWRDKDSWAPYGPGSQRGMCRLMGVGPKKNRYNHGQFSYLLKELVTDVKREVGVPGIEAMDVQNCCCEVDKYERILWGEGVPKQRYPGT